MTDKFFGAVDACDAYGRPLADEPGFGNVLSMERMAREAYWCAMLCD